MTTQVQLDYTATTTVLSSTNTAAVMRGVQLLPIDLLALGLRVITDVTNEPTGTSARRRVVLGFTPSVAATAVAVMQGNGIKVASATVTAAGQDYPVPPIVSFAGASNAQTKQAKGYSRLTVAAIDSLAGGGGYSGATIVRFVGGLPPAIVVQKSGENQSENLAGQTSNKANGPPYALNAISISDPGAGYALATTQVLIQGGLDPNDPLATPAQAVVSAVTANGGIAAVTVIDPGRRYLFPPKIHFLDTANPTGAAQQGFRAQAAALMGAGDPAQGTPTIALNVITGITIASGGTNYVQAPAVVITDTGGGAGASATLGMGVGKIVVTYPGEGYLQGQIPTIALTPLFKSLFPDGSNQSAPFKFFPLTVALKQALPSQIVTTAPVVT